MFDCEFPTDWQSAKRSSASSSTTATTAATTLAELGDAPNKSKRKIHTTGSTSAGAKSDEKRPKKNKTVSSLGNESAVEPAEVGEEVVPVAEQLQTKTLVSPTQLGNVARFASADVTSATIDCLDKSSFFINFSNGKITPSKNSKIKQLILKQFQSILAAHTYYDSSRQVTLMNECSSVMDQEEASFVQQTAMSNPMQLDTENLLSKLPYKKMLKDMFGGNLRGRLHMTNIPYVTRAYEEAFMHELTNSSERECAKGKMCECMFIDKTQPFVCVEFLLPGEKPPRTPNMCVLCYRAVTQQLYYDVIFDKCEFPGCIQKFGNIHSEQGEYSLESMLIAAPSAPVHIMPLPIVSHQRNRYQVFNASGVKRLKQSKVYFQHTPSCNLDLGPSCP